MRRLVSLSLLSCLVLAAGCDGGDSLLGAFVGQTTVGADVRTVEGEAVYTVVETAVGPEFVLGLFVGDLYASDREAYDYVLFRRPGARPGVGAYAVEADPDRAVGATIARVEDADDPLAADGVALAGTRGTLAVTAVDGYGFVAGAYDVEAEGLRLPPRAGRVAGAARGTFEARYVPPSTFRRLGLDLGF